MKEYFSHDHNARHDRKVVALVNKYKSSGYGIFWAVNEMMHEEGGELELDEITYTALAKHLNEDIAYIQQVIKDCEAKFLLYQKIDNRLTSNRVIRNITEREEKKQAKSEKAASAGKIGGIKSGESRRSKQTLQANEAPLEAERSNEAKVKESILNESIVNIVKGSSSDFICNDAEYYILNNKQLFEKICIATFKGLDVAKKELHSFHLWLEKNNKYPSNNRAVAAGFESWLINDYKKNYNGSSNQSEQPKIKLK